MNSTQFLVYILLSVTGSSSCDDPNYGRGSDRGHDEAPADPNTQEAGKTDSNKQAPSSNELPSFMDYCQNENSYSQAIKQTLSELKQIAETSDCKKASQVLSERSNLNLAARKISDLSPIAHFVVLRKLFIAGNGIKDLSPLSALNNLEYLSASQNQVSDLSPLTGLPRLKAILLNGNPLSDTGALRKLQALHYAWVDDNAGLKVQRFIQETLSSVNSEKLLWRYGEGVCFGGWSYKPYLSCRTEANGVEKYKLARSEACGIENRERVAKKCRHRAHGIESYEDPSVYSSDKLSLQLNPNTNGAQGWKEQLSKACDERGKTVQRENLEFKVDTKVEGMSLSSGYVASGDCKILVAKPIYKETEDGIFCGYYPDKITYRECEHPSHGVELYKMGPNAVCGISDEIKASQSRANRVDVSAIGSPVQCLTCDDIQVDSSDNVAKKFSCLRGVIDAGSTSSENRTEAVSALKLLYLKKTENLFPEQVDYVQLIDTGFSDVGYENAKNL